MSSWFNLDSINSTLTESLTQVSSSLDTVKSKVQSTLHIDDDLVQALTLQTAGLTAEREKIDAEERRKEIVRDYLAEILPWETRDEEREILVEECRELILLLSTREDTFRGPYKLLDFHAEQQQQEEEVGEEDVKEGAVKEQDKDEPSDEEEEEADATKQEEDVEGAATKEDTEKEEKEEEIVPHQDKLAKLEPLPPLLADFDLDTHVGLIQKILEVDSNLVEMHSQLSAKGAGEREVNFWRNYFFHCAFTRYEVGLSIDEIWASKPVPPCTGELAETEAIKEELKNSVHDEGLDVASHSSHGEIVFEADSNGDAELDVGDEDVIAPQKATEASSAAATPAAAATAEGGISNSPSSNSTQDNSYEMIANEAAAAAAEDDDDVVAIVGDAGGASDVADDDDGDLDLDDLDAEIARELED